MNAPSVGNYAKGKGAKEYYAWLERTHPTDLYVKESRAAGGRQDLVFEGCVAIYMNRLYYLEFLTEVMRDSKHENILEDYCYVVLISSDMLALVRAHAAMYVAFVTELRRPAAPISTHHRGDASASPVTFVSAKYRIDRDVPQVSGGQIARAHGLVAVLDGPRGRPLRVGDD